MNENITRRRIRKNSFGLKILKVLFDLETVWKKDLSLYMLSYVSTQAATRIWKELEQMELIKIEKDRTDRLAVTITKQGRYYLAENDSDPYFRNSYRTVKSPSYLHSSSDKTYIRGMTLAGVKMMFMGCGIPVSPREKPALDDLYNALVSKEILSGFGESRETSESKAETDARETDIQESGQDSESIEETDEIDDEIDEEGDSDPYESSDPGSSEDEEDDLSEYRKMTADEMRDRLKTGMFYSVAEFREGINRLGIGDPIALSGSRCYGIFLSADKYFIVYAAPFDRSIRLSKAVEMKLLRTVYAFAAQVTEYKTMRRLPFQYGKTGSVTNCAIVITNGTGLVKTMATGVKHGKDEYGAVNDYLISRGVKVAKADVVRDTIFSSDKTMYATHLEQDRRENRVRLLLNHDCELFNKIYAVESNNIGTNSLSYLLFTSVEEYRAEYLSFLELPGIQGRADFTSNRNEEFCIGVPLLNSPDPDNPRKCRIVFLPAYDINAMTEMRRNYHNAGERFLIVTRKEMAKTISAVVGGSCVFYDQLTKQPIEGIPCYNKNGYTPEAAEKKQKAISKKYDPIIRQRQMKAEIRRLEKKKHSLPQQNRAEVNREIRDLKQKLDTDEKSVYIQFELPASAHKQLVEAARNSGMTMKEYLTRLVMASGIETEP